MLGCYSKRRQKPESFSRYLPALFVAMFPSLNQENSIRLEIPKLTNTLSIQQENECCN